MPGHPNFTPLHSVWTFSFWKKMRPVRQSSLRAHWERGCKQNVVCATFTSNYKKFPHSHLLVHMGRPVQHVGDPHLKQLDDLVLARRQDGKLQHLPQAVLALGELSRGNVALKRPVRRREEERGEASVSGSAKEEGEGIPRRARPRLTHMFGKQQMVTGSVQGGTGMKLVPRPPSTQVCPLKVEVTRVFMYRGTWEEVRSAWIRSSLDSKSFT